MSGFEVAEEEERRRKRAPWGVIALVLLTGLALVRNGSGEFDVGPPHPPPPAAADRPHPHPVHAPAAHPLSIP
ncbi:class F sortase, partial [Streptomyces chartreusis]